MSYEYSENILVQDRAANLLHDELSWEVAYACNTEKLGVNGTFGRKSHREIVRWRYFRQAVTKLNLQPAEGRDCLLSKLMSGEFV